MATNRQGCRFQDAATTCIIAPKTCTQRQVHDAGVGRMETLIRRSLLQRLAPICAAALATLVASPAWTQSWPSRPITMVVPFPAGGAPDIVARFLSDGLGQRLGQR